jgi:alpha-glucosidase
VPPTTAGSTHRYDSTTFDGVDPLLGGDRSLADLTEEAHRRGIKVLGDITLNHCGATHEWFLRARDGQMPERDFFRFDDSLEHGYESWLGVPSLPKFDFTSTELLQMLVVDEASAIRRWLQAPYSLDGWRVDVANMAGRLGAIDITHELAREVRRVMIAEQPEAYLVAEHGHDASEDLSGDGWHGTMNYSGFTRQVWCWLKCPEFTETFLGLPVEPPDLDGHQFVASLRAFHGRIPWRSLLGSWNILSSHDSARIRTVVGSADRQIAAFALSVGMPGIAMIFAGDEVGATGWWGEDSRTPFPWDEVQAWDGQVLQAYRALIDLRRHSPALAEGGLRWVQVEADAIAFLREHPDERLLLVVSRGQREPLRIPLDAIDRAACTHVLGFEGVAASDHLTVQLPSAGVGIWRLDAQPDA